MTTLFDRIEADEAAFCDCVDHLDAALANWMTDHPVHDVGEVDRKTLADLVAAIILVNPGRRDADLQGADLAGRKLLWIDTTGRRPVRRHPD